MVSVLKLLADVSVILWLDTIVTSSSLSGIPSASVPVKLQVAGALHVPDETLEKVAAETILEISRTKVKSKFFFILESFVNKVNKNGESYNSNYMIVNFNAIVIVENVNFNT